jgi:hypothetical protein
MGAEVFHATGQTDMTLIVAFRSFANAPNKILTGLVLANSSIDVILNYPCYIVIHFL